MSSEAVKQGWLNKKGGGKRRANWTRRFFVLHKDKLDYFTDDKLTCLKGSVPIDGTLLTFNVVPFSEKKCAFVMALPNRDFVMQAATDVEMNGYVGGKGKGKGRKGKGKGKKGRKGRKGKGKGKGKGKTKVFTFFLLFLQLDSNFIADLYDKENRN